VKLAHQEMAERVAKMMCWRQVAMVPKPAVSVRVVLLIAVDECIASSDEAQGAQKILLSTVVVLCFRSRTQNRGGEGVVM
jgi:hypothetical protein